MNINKYECSIVIPVRNGEAFISDCFQSILEQDTKSQFEVIFVNDHSTDRTNEILQEYAMLHGNLRILDANGTGIASAINQGILEAQSEIILRMDADDIMVPNRLSMQLAFFANNLDCVLLGGQIRTFGNTSSLPTPNVYPSSHGEILRMLAKGNAFAHPTVAFKKEAALSVGLYDSNFDGAEDYEFWTRLASKGRLHNLTQLLVNYRIHEHQVTKKKMQEVQRKTYKTQLRWIVLSSPVGWNLPLQKVIIYKIEGAIFLFFRVCRDRLVRLKNAC